MQRFIILLSLLVAILTAGAVRAEVDGRKLLDWCQSKYDQKDFCLFYISGAEDGMQFVLEMIKKPYCFPDGTTRSQTQGVVLTYLREHPQKLHLPAAGLIGEALAIAYSCKR
jgi:hypothetical protein